MGLMPSPVKNSSPYLDGKVTLKTDTAFLTTTTRNPLSKVIETHHGTKAYTSHPTGQVVFVNKRPPPPPSERSRSRQGGAAASSTLLLPVALEGVAVTPTSEKINFVTRGKSQRSLNSRKDEESEQPQAGLEEGGVDPLQGYFNSLEEMLKRVCSGRHTRECSQELVRFAAEADEPFSVGNSKKNPWIVDLFEGGQREEDTCCSIT